MGIVILLSRVLAYYINMKGGSYMDEILAFIKKIFVIQIGLIE